MEILRTREDIFRKIARFKSEGYSTGLVPTMGALHDGHNSLVKKAKEENDRVVVSIFVNPTQFNDPEDLKKYPRTEEKDLSILETLHVDFVFMPEVREMYPEKGGDQRIFDLHPLDSVMEGRFRKNHFHGVAQIVTKLFETIPADRAYFGQKDFQQLVIVKKLVFLMGYNIEIISCPIVRESDGLAMSSRNMLLSPEERNLAPFISQTLFKARSLMEKHTPEQLEKWVEEQFRNHKQFKFEYFEIVDDLELKKIRDWSEKSNKVGCIAVHLGKIRLIDNIIFV